MTQDREKLTSNEESAVAAAIVTLEQIRLRMEEAVLYPEGAAGNFIISERIEAACLAEVALQKLLHTETEFQMDELEEEARRQELNEMLQRELNEQRWREENGYA